MCEVALNIVFSITNSIGLLDTKNCMCNDTNT